MSRIGKLPIELPDNVDVKIDNDQIIVKGPKGSVTKKYNPLIDIKVEDGEIKIVRNSDSKADKSLQGMTRSIVESMVEGVVNGFEKKLGMVGVGYNAQVKGNTLELEVGYSHPVQIEAEQEIEFEVEKGRGDIRAIIIVKGIDKQKVGEIAAKIREIRKPEPYKGKGIRYIGEHIRRKEGKTG